VNLGQFILIFLLRAYRILVSPVLTTLFGPQGLGCRFSPTCSQYALEAVQRHGAVRGAALATSRLCRCHPWGGRGEDPVPPKDSQTPQTGMSAPQVNAEFTYRSNGS